MCALQTCGWIKDNIEGWLPSVSQATAANGSSVDSVKMYAVHVRACILLGCTLYVFLVHVRVYYICVCGYDIHTYVYVRVGFNVICVL